MLKKVLYTSSNQACRTSPQSEAKTSRSPPGGQSYHTS